MDEVSVLSYEEAFEKLERSVTSLQDGRLPLERALECYEEGMKLALHCQQLLQKAEIRIQQLRITSEGDVGVEPMEDPL